MNLLYLGNYSTRPQIKEKNPNLIETIFHTILYFVPVVKITQNFTDI
ncbi:hypothetical protein Echvi_3278 [Echinicola vietnamensis DSM 17526]|uniref:Uncharacterized protein n=1 Tax=Echinicola vietnamensis (strain DSM 17526 / LMG 23754 / KMM 6221) TaxID=926556 RepID=L0G1X0_ECHVK|nr:hypothetical protein Echvi_3278 [Echinicola vietnamensis DSM 17526]